MWNMYRSNDVRWGSLSLINSGDVLHARSEIRPAIVAGPAPPRQNRETNRVVRRVSASGFTERQLRVDAVWKRQIYVTMPCQHVRKRFA